MTRDAVIADIFWAGVELQDDRISNALAQMNKDAIEMKRLRARVAELESAQRMRPMSELTDGDGEVFIWSRDRRYPFIANYRAYGALNANSEHVQAIIGWTPIPPLPEPQK